LKDNGELGELMMKQNGRLITVWVPGNHGAGGSTVADGIGIGMQYLIGMKTLIVNFSGKWSYMERFLENDISIKYSMDYLKSFGQAIDFNHINTFSTQINNKLSIIPGTKLQSCGDEDDRKFEKCLLQRCLEGYDFVIADITTGIRDDNKALLDMSDIIIAVMTPNEIMLDDIVNELGKTQILKYLRDSKTIPVFNMMGYKNNIERELRRLSVKYDFEACFGINTDDSVFEACCKDKKMYTYMMNGLEKGTEAFPKQIEELCVLIAEKLGIVGYDSENTGASLIKRLFRRR
jgi:cellulose biosynthesis protein BcsQ